jgi:hypothetical protein
MEKPDGTLVAVTDGGGLLPSPPDLNTVPAESLGYSSDVGTLVIDQWGRVIVPFYPPGSFGVATDGSSKSEALNPYSLNPPAWPPTEWPSGSGSLPSSLPQVYNDHYRPDAVKYWIDPDSGQVALVEGDNSIATSGPMVQQIGGKVVDQWGNEIQPLWPPADLGIDETGSPTGVPTMPEGFTPPTMSYWQDPTTGKYVAVDESGTPLVSPPQIVEYGGKVVDQWGNEIQPLWPPADLGIDETGSPTGATTMPEGFSSPVASYWEDPATGKLVALDENGYQVTSPPLLTKLSGEARDALGYPPGEYELVVDQWGNPVIPANPPGSFGVDASGSPLPDAGTVPPWPPDEWPPGSGPDETLDLEEGEMTIPLDELEGFAPADTALDPESMTIPTVEVTEAAPDFEETSANLGEGGSDPADSYSGVEHTAGPVALDDDLNETAEESLVTAGLDESVPPAAAAGREADMSEPPTVEVMEELLVDGLVSPEYKLDEVEEAAFKVEDPVGVVEEAAFKVEQTELVDDLAEAPLPTVEPVTEAEMKLIEPIETVDYVKAVESEESTIEPIEIVIETLDSEIGGRVAEPEEIPGRFAAAEEDYDDEEEEPQP